MNKETIHIFNFMFPWDIYCDVERFLFKIQVKCNKFWTLNFTFRYSNNEQIRGLHSKAIVLNFSMLG